MKKKIKIFITLIFAIILLVIFQNKVDARSYSVDNMDIQATVQENGSVKIVQKITYKFNGEYNGIYINVPYNLEDIEYDEIVKSNKINDNLYNGVGVTLNNVSVIKNGSEINYQKSYYGTNGKDGIYTEERDNGMYKLKVYSPSVNTTKTFKLDYTIDNLCVKHNDIGELYYNFIGGAWDVTIKKLNIDIFIPNNKTQLNIWGHGPYEGESKIINNTHANFAVNNVKPGQYVAARVLFDNSNIALSNKLSKIDAKDIIFADENSIIENKEEKNEFTKKVFIFAMCLLIYWIILIVVFEKDKKYKLVNIEDDKLFEKYNPMIAGCIQGSRTILARDIIAVILNLINKKNIKFDFQNQIKGRDNYNYIVTKNPELEDKMDEVEQYVYNWLFDGREKQNLQDRLKQMPKEPIANKKFKDLNKIVEKNLTQIGANEAKVPMWVRVFNVFLFIIALLVVIKHILFNGFSVYSSSAFGLVVYRLIIIIIPLFPLAMALLYIPINLIIVVRHKINKCIQKITGQRVVTTTVSLVILFGIIIALTYVFSPVKYLVVDEILICIGAIIVLTDNLMLKNNPTMIEDYSKLNMLKDKIENYSMMEDKDVEHVVLWEKYLSYAVSFGLASKIVKRIKGLNLDDDLLNVIYNESFVDFITSDYYLFYNYASLDRRFLRAYSHATGTMMKAIGSASSSGSGGRRRLFWWRRFLWRRRKPEEAVEPFRT